MARFGATQIYDPQVRSNTLARIFLGLFGTFDTCSSHLHFIRYARTIDFDRVLDAGCGKGKFTFWLAQEYPDAEVYGCDISAEKIAHCKEVRDLLGIRNAHFFVQDLRNFERDQAYDFIFTNHALEHIRENRLVIRKLCRSLKEGGHIYVQMPDAVQKRLTFGKRFVKSHEEWAREEHVGQTLTLESLCTALEHNNCKTIKAMYTEGFWGELRFELSEMALSYFRSHFLLGLMYPLLRILGHIDAWSEYSDGNGVLVLAMKST